MQAKKYKLIFQAIEYDEPFWYFIDSLRDAYTISKVLINYAKKVYDITDILNIELHAYNEETGSYGKTTIFDKQQKVA